MKKFYLWSDYHSPNHKRAIKVFLKDLFPENNMWRYLIELYDRAYTGEDHATKLLTQLWNERINPNVKEPVELTLGNYKEDN